MTMPAARPKAFCFHYSSFCAIFNFRRTKRTKSRQQRPATENKNSCQAFFSLQFRVDFFVSVFVLFFYSPGGVPPALIISWLNLSDSNHFKSISLGVPLVRRRHHFMAGKSQRERKRAENNETESILSLIRGISGHTRVRETARAK